MTSPLSLLSKAESFMSRDRWSRAEPLLLRASRCSGDLFLLAEILSRRAECLRALGRFREAVGVYQSALRIFRRLRVAPEQMKSALGASACLRILGRYAEATRLWRTMEKRVSFRPAFSDADVEMERALVARGQGRWHEARRRLAKARRGLVRRGDRAGLQHARWIEGGLERFSGRLRASRKAFRESVRLARRAGSRENIAYALCGLAGVQRVLGEGEASLENYREAFGVFQRSRDPFGRAYGLCGQANALRTYGNACPALNLYRRSAALYRRLGDESSEGFAQWGLGGSFRRLGRWRESAGAYGRAEALFRKSGDDRGLAMVRLGKARLAESTGDQALAQNLLAPLPSWAREKGLIYEAALARYESGRLRRPGRPPHSILRPLGIPPAALRRWRDIP